MTQLLDDGRLNPSKTPCFWREIVAAASSLRPRKQTNYADLKKTKAGFLYEAVQLLLTNIFTLICIMTISTYMTGARSEMTRKLGSRCVKKRVLAPVV